MFNVQRGAMKEKQFIKGDNSKRITHKFETIIHTVRYFRHLAINSQHKDPPMFNTNYILLTKGGNQCKQTIKGDNLKMVKIIPL